MSQSEKESNLSLCTGAGKTRIIQELLFQKKTYKCIIVFQLNGSQLLKQFKEYLKKDTKKLLNTDNTIYSFSLQIL